MKKRAHPTTDEVRAACMLVEPASYYCKIMTRAEQMPELVHSFTRFVTVKLLM